MMKKMQPICPILPLQHAIGNKRANSKHVKTKKQGHEKKLYSPPLEPVTFEPLGENSSQSGTGTPPGSTADFCTIPSHRKMKKKKKGHKEIETGDGAKSSSKGSLKGKRGKSKSAQKKKKKKKIIDTNWD